MPSSSVARFVVFLVLSAIVLKETHALKCFSCIALDCRSQNFVCNSAHQYILRTLGAYYYEFDGQNSRVCPGLDNEVAWEAMTASAQSCSTVCVVSHLKIVSQIVDTRENITSYGTVLGCAKRRLVDEAALALKQNECGLLRGISQIKDTLRHSLEVEQCWNDQCYLKDFCHSKELSEVKVFREDLPESTGSNNVWVIIGSFGAIGVIVAILGFLGIKYG